MSIRHALFTSVAAGALIASSGAHAAPVKHRRHRVTTTTTTTTRAPGLSEEVRELRAQVQALQSRLDAQGSQQQAAISQTQSQVAQVQSQVAATDARVSAVPQEIATSIDTATEKAHHADKFYFKGITITPGGFLELAGIYRQRNQESDIATGYNAIPYYNSRLGQLREGRFSARQSRVSFLAQGAVNKRVNLAMYGEFDFQGAAQTANSNESNSYTPRIRNLYGTLDYASPQGYGFHFLAGQNWSLVTLNSKGITPRNEAPPPVIEAQYVPGFVWARQPQIRATADFLDHKLWLAVSAENPQTTYAANGAVAGVPGPGGVPTVGATAALPGALVFNGAAGSGFNSINTLSTNHIPDVVGKVAYEATVAGRGAHIEAWGLFKSVYYRYGATGNQNVNAGGVGASIAASVIPKYLDLQFSYAQGVGIGRYGTSQLPDTTFDFNGNAKPIRESMLLAGGTAHFGKQLDVYGFAGEELDRSNFSTTAAGAAYGYGNPLYTNAGCNIEGNAACVGNTRSIRQVTGGAWDKIYQGSFGRAQIGVQYSYTERRSFAGVGGVRGGRNNIAFLSFRYYPF